MDTVMAVESRGFILGSALADRLGTGFVPVRKPGKLPSKTIRLEYDLEYGTDCVEVHADAFRKGERVLVVDDVIATGGTALGGGGAGETARGARSRPTHSWSSSRSWTAGSACPGRTWSASSATECVSAVLGPC